MKAGVSTQELNKVCPQILANTGKWSRGHKPWPDGLALALQDSRLGQSPQEASILAWLGLAYLGPIVATTYMI